MVENILPDPSGRRKRCSRQSDPSSDLHGRVRTSEHPSDAAESRPRESRHWHSLDREAVRASTNIVELVGEVVPLRRAGRDWVGLCPFHKEKTASFSVSPSRGTYYCFGCGAHGDVFSFVQNILGLGFRDAIEYLNRRVGGNDLHHHQRPVARDGHALPPPPVDQVAGLWGACQPVSDDAEVHGWLLGRALDPSRVADDDLARALPVSARVPRWARCRGLWPHRGYRIILPLYDARGKLASVHARSVSGMEPKGALPAGFSARGLVLADDAGRQILRTGEITSGGIWITEGVPDFLTVTGAWGQDAEVAVLGILAGSWTNDVAERIPDGARIVIAVHHDVAGVEYERRIVQSLAGRCVLQRWVPKAVTS